MGWMQGLEKAMGFTPVDGTQIAADQAANNQKIGQQNFDLGRQSATGYNPFSAFGYDANGNQYSTLTGGLGTAATDQGNNLGLLSSQLPGTFVDFSNSTPQQIAAQGTAALQQMQMPYLTQALNQLDINDTNRGLPVGSEARNTDIGNFARNFAAGTSTGNAAIWNAIPQNQATMAGTAQMEGLSPYQIMAAQGQNLGLLKGLATSPQYVAPNFQTTNYGQIELGAADQNNKLAGNIWSGVGDILGAGMNYMFPGSGTLMRTASNGLFGTGTGSLGVGQTVGPGYGQV